MLSLGSGGVSWWWYAIGAAVLAMYFKGRNGGGLFIHVPDGENWRAVYREQVINRRKERPNMRSRLMFGAGLGIALAAIMWALQ